MVTTHKNALTLYDRWFEENYEILQEYCHRFRISEDILNDVYINVKDRITRSGFTESYYTTYVKRSIRNLQINEAKKLNGKYYIEFDNEDYSVTVENQLQFQQETDDDTKQYREEVMFLSKKIFEYLMYEKRVSEESLWVFRCYYLMSGRMTYKKLNVMTGINKNTCTKIIKEIKTDIRTNFLTWLKNDEIRNSRSNDKAKANQVSATI